jgi:hypothetical protein
LSTDKKSLTVREVQGVNADTLARGAQSILFLPLNWGSDEDKPVYAPSTDSVVKLFAQKGIPSNAVSSLSTETLLKDERAMDWLAPTLCVTALMFAQNPIAVSLALTVIANYATDLFKGIRRIQV